MPVTPPAPETPDFELPPDADDLDLGSLVIDKAARPYVTAWYTAARQPGDTPLQFVLRMLYRQAIAHRRAVVVSTNADAHRDQARDYAVDIDDAAGLATQQAEALLP